MTDKQINDGIDVSGCDCFIEKMNFPNNLEGGYYNQNNICECGIQGVESYPFFCKDNPDCYYKQLKRKEQECEQSKKENKVNLSRSLDLNKELSQLSEENAELKAENETYKKMLDDTEVRVALIDVKTGERELWRNLGMKADKFKQTLTEIKAIAKNMNTECFYSDFDCEDCDMKNGCTYFNKKQILQKISECEVK